MRDYFRKAVCLLLCGMLFNVPAFYAEGAVFAEDAGVAVSPILSMPPISYEGHTEIISDRSVYSAGGVSYTAKSAYEAGISVPTFEPLQYDGISMSDGDIVSEKKITFYEPGIYTVQLMLDVSDGKTYTAKDSTHVQSTPSIESAISGAHKQNRRQLIDFRIASNPYYPVKDIKMVIENKDGSEKTDIVFLSEGTVMCKGASSQNIKIGDINCTETDNRYFYEGSVEFLTKYSDEQMLSYTISAEDVRGYKDQSCQEITIYPDLPPEADIDIEKSYIREKGSDKAVITVSDGTSYDGDQGLRQWSVKLEPEGRFIPAEDIEGFQDLSMGSGSKISFYKESVGKFQVKLKVKDKWSEGTINAYIDDSEVLSDEAEASSEVVNIAPFVSMGIGKSIKADVLVAGDISESENLENDIAALNIAFLENGIDADIYESITDRVRLGSSSEDSMNERFTATGPFGYPGNTTAFENRLFAIDDINLYRVDAVWTDPDNGKPEEPFTVSCYDAESGEKRWTYMFDDSDFGFDYDDADLWQDDTQQYLYLVSGGNTLVISKSSGQCESVLSVETGQYSFAGDRFIYTYKTDGIYRISLADGNCKKIYTADFHGEVRRINGKVTAYTMNSKNQIRKVLLDPENEKITSEFIGSFEEESYIPYGYDNSGGKVVLETAGIDSDGDAVLKCSAVLVNSAGGTSRTYTTAVRVYGADGTLLKERTYKSSYNMKVVPVTDRKGNFNYYGITMAGKDSVTVNAVGIRDGYEDSLTIYDDNGDPCIYENVIMSAERNGKIEITMGAYCTWIYNDSWANGGRHGYPERCTTVIFDPAAGTAKKSGTLIEGCHAMSEYGNESDMYLAVQTSRNSQYAGSAVIENTVIRKSQTISEILVKQADKFLGDTSDESTSVMIIYADKSLSEAEYTDLKKVISSHSCRVFIIGDTSGDGCDIAQSIGATFIDQDGKYISELVSYIAENENELFGTCVKLSYESEKLPVLKRQYNMSQGQEYDIELEFMGNLSAEEYEKIISAEHVTDSILGEDIFSEDSYYVTDIITEDFSDNEKEKFFEYSSYTVSGGLYTDCSISREGSSNVYRSDTSTITFEVPEGKKGILSFDYRLLRDGDYINGNYADIDGKRWLLFSLNTDDSYIKGNYVHPYVLNEGVHKIVLGTGSYGADLKAYTYIDNLCFSYISEDKPSVALENIECMPAGENRYRLTGSFTTPAEVFEYRALRDVEYISGVPGKASYTKYDASDSNYRYLTLQIPDDKKSLLTNVKTESSPKNDYSVSYSWITGNGSWVCRDNISPAQNALNTVPKDWIITLPPVSGKQEFKSSFKSYRYTSAEFSEVEMFIAEEENSLINENQFICAEGSEGKTLFVGNGRYNGKTVVNLEFPSEVEVYSFSICMKGTGEKIYIEDNGFSCEEELKRWENVSGRAEFAISSEISGSDRDVPVFEKGELVNYTVTYSDYEDDPSKSSYWRYTHTPMNDGAHEDAAVVLHSAGNKISETGKILNKPIERFYLDGKYTVEHWQTDDTTRGTVKDGDPVYDKDSNVVSYTFYIRSSGEIPWVKYIYTDPYKVYEDDSCSIVAAVDDMMKDTLEVRLEVYKDEQCVFSEVRQGIESDEDGTYDILRFDRCIPDAECGKYDVYCTVSDRYGTGFDTYSFTVLSRGSLSGTVHHTEKWEENRQKYNQYVFGEKYDKISDPDIYAGALSKGPRGKNVFWAGEKFIMDITSEGDPVQVKSWVKGYEDELYAVLEETEQNHYKGCIWSENMDVFWNDTPQILTVCTSATYENGEILLIEERMIMDNRYLFWELQKTA